MNHLCAERQYLNLLRDVLNKGVDIKNKRTNQTCRTLINANLTYDASTEVAPLITTRKAPTKLPIAELLGYLKGFTSAEQFRNLGTTSWDANANENEAWLKNPVRKGTDDLGLIYGAVAQNWFVLREDKNSPYHVQIDRTMNLFRKVYDNLKEGIDDRGEIITFYQPGLFDLGALRPCLHSYQFSLVGDDLYLHAFQRSMDVPLGGASNMVQVYLLLRLMAQITNKNPRMAYHTVVNAHIYENQFEGVREQISRPILSPATLEINPDIKTLRDIETWVSLNDFQYSYNEYHPPINYPFSV